MALGSLRLLSNFRSSGFTLSFAELCRALFRALASRQRHKATSAPTSLRMLPSNVPSPRFDAARTATPAVSCTGDAPGDAPFASSTSSPPGVLRVGGVPEHFNLPWHLAIERGVFASHDVAVEWVSQPMGTGQMVASLKSGACDVVVALTEGLVLEIAKGATGPPCDSDIKLIGTYVESPLVWAVSSAGPATACSGRYPDVASLRGSTFGVSRLGSGSHLMAYCFAQQQGWDAQRDVAVSTEGSFGQLRASVGKGTTSAFLWETFMSKPYYVNGELAKLAEFPSPWPCFMIATRRDVSASRAPQLQRMLAALQEVCVAFRDARTESVARVSAEFHLSLGDAETWFDAAVITGADSVSAVAIQRAMGALRDVGVLPPECDPDLELFVDERVGSLRHNVTDVMLYRHSDLLVATMCNLRAAGQGDGPLSFEELAKLQFDQHHYNGVTAVEEAAGFLSLSPVSTGACSKPGANVLSIGSGLGGPARFLAGRYGVAVTAVELQPDLHAAAAELTHRCGLSAAVAHVCADVLALLPSLPPDSFTGVVAWLTLLHFPPSHRATVYRHCHRVLGPGGVLYFADFFDGGGLTADERARLTKDVRCASLPTLEQCAADVTAAGFVDVVTRDVTADWVSSTAARADAFQRDRERFLAVTHGRAGVFARLSQFYCLIAALFAGGHLGGVVVTARKPS